LRIVSHPVRRQDCRRNKLMKNNKVVVTGIGVVTPLGFGRELNWKSVIEGKSAVKERPLENMLSARVRNLDVPAETRLLSLAFLAAAEALEDAGIDFHDFDTARFGCTVSSSKPNIVTGKNGALVLPEIGAQSVLPGQIARVFKLRGPVRNIVAACATGADSVIIGAEWIRRGLCDAVLCGAAEAPFNDLYCAGFSRMGVLAKTAVKPFDRRREGFALGEGSGVLVLENYDTAFLRGAKMYGTVESYAMANDAWSPVSFEPQGRVIADAITRSLGKTGIPGYVNAHGTATRANDAVETAALKRAFGAGAASLSVSSTKAATGHMLGASGAVELGFCLLAMRDNVLPPTLNLTDPDPCCDLDYIAGSARRKEIKSALSLSFGFGGHIAAVLLTECLT